MRTAQPSSSWASSEFRSFFLESLRKKSQEFRPMSDAQLVHLVALGDQAASASSPRTHCHTTSTVFNSLSHEATENAIQWKIARGLAFNDITRVTEHARKIS